MPKEVVHTCPIVNAHPGYLPNVRGRDALKWAILEGQPVGVTTHVISEETDAGLLIKQALVPIRPTDTFQTVANRQYDMEIQMLSESISDMRRSPHLTPLDGSRFAVHKRMPQEKEKEMLNKFQEMITRISGIMPRP